MALSSAHPNPHVLVVQITEYDLKSDDKYLIIATDGVWEFLESRDAATIGWEAMQTSQPGKGRGDSKVPALSADAACTALIVASATKWQEFEGDYRDDITAIVVRTNPFDLMDEQKRLREEQSRRRRSRASFTADDSPRRLTDPGDDA